MIAQRLRKITTWGKRMHGEQIEEHIGRDFSKSSQTKVYLTLQSEDSLRPSQPLRPSDDDKQRIPNDVMVKETYPFRICLRPLRHFKTK